MTDPWGGEVDTASARDVVGPDRSADYTPARGAKAWSQAVAALGDITEGVRLLDYSAPDACAYKIDTRDTEHVIVMVTHIAALRADLARTEAWLTRQVGQDEMAPRKGVLPDGREYEVKRGSVRKSWDHDAWQGQVREQVTSGLLDEVYGEDGNVVGSLSDVIAAAQAVHGSTGPRVTALRGLGLAPDEFCESVPGPWQVVASSPYTESDQIADHHFAGM